MSARCSAEPRPAPRERAGGVTILVIDAALAHGTVAIVGHAGVQAARSLVGGRGHSTALAPAVVAVLEEACVTLAALDAIAVTTGPGSFTGLRASIALAQGLAAASGLPLVGVSVAEALAAALQELHGRTLWVATLSRRDRIFLHRDGGTGPVPLDALPPADGPLAIAGDAAIAVAARLAARGDDVRLTDARYPDAVAIATVAATRLHDGAPRPTVLPLYIDAPEARLPAGGLRPAPISL